MYDPKSELQEFVGDDRAEAVAAAAQFFGVEESELKIKVLTETEVSGLAPRTIVVAIPTNAERPAPRDDDDRGPRGRGRDRGDRDRGGRDRDRDRGGRGRDRDRGGRGGRDRDRGGRGGRDRDRDRGGRGERSSRDDRDDRDDRGNRAEPAAAAAIPEGPSEATRVGDLSAAGEFVAGVIEHMELGPFEIEDGEDGDLAVVQLRGGAADYLTGGDGRAIDAIQLLANQAAMRNDENAPRVVLDVDGDREQRESYLEDLAQRAARRALKIKRAVALDPMNGAERRILHVALRDAEDVATMSTGSGRYRQVVVVPKGAPEYDEARKSSQEAATRD